MRQVHAGEHVDGGVYVDIADATIWHFTAGEAYGPPTVLLHGLFASASSWGTQIPAFLDAGRQLFVPERSGHGHSPDLPGDSWSRNSSITAYASLRGRAKRGTGEDAVVSMPDVEMRAGDAGSAMISDAAGESRHAHAGRRLW